MCDVVRYHMILMQMMRPGSDEMCGYEHIGERDMGTIQFSCVYANESEYIYITGWFIIYNSRDVSYCILSRDN